MNALLDAIDLFDGMTAMGRRIGTSPQRIDNWVKRGTPVPEIFAIAIERESGGAVPITALRPDLAQALADAGYVRAPASAQLCQRPAAGAEERAG